jgi:hypothetical protein
MDGGVCMRSTHAALLKLSILTSLQSVSQTLHTSAAPLIASLIDCHLTNDTANLSYTLLRRVLNNFSVPCKSRPLSVQFVRGLDYLVCLHCFYALR